MQLHYVEHTTYKHKMQIFLKKKNYCLLSFNFTQTSYFLYFLRRIGNNINGYMATRLLDC